MYVRYDGSEALQWANQHFFAYWMVLRYERTNRMIVLRGWPSDSKGEFGFLVLRGVQAVDLTGHLGEATFDISTRLPEHSGLVSEQDNAVEPLQVMHISGDEQDTYIAFCSLSAYELTETTQENF